MNKISFCDENREKRNAATGSRNTKSPCGAIINQTGTHSYIYSAPCKGGAEKAYSFLIEHDFGKDFAQKVAECIRTHRYRSDDPPQSLEAKILFDADKIDATGATGIARILIYKGRVSEPLYSVRQDGSVPDESKDVLPSFFQEYQYKLKNVILIYIRIRGRR